MAYKQQGTKRAKKSESVRKALLMQFRLIPRPTFEKAIISVRKKLKLNSNTLKKRHGRGWWNKFENGNTSLRIKRVKTKHVPVQLTQSDGFKDNAQAEYLAQLGDGDKNILLSTIFKQNNSYVINCPRCLKKWPYLSAPNLILIRSVLSNHLQNCEVIVKACKKIRNADKLDYKIAKPYKIAKCFDHRLNSGHSLPCFYNVRSKIAPVYDFYSFRCSIMYRGIANSNHYDPYFYRSQRHKETCKFDFTIAEMFPVLFANDVKWVNYIESVDILTAEKNELNSNFRFEIVPIVQMTDDEFQMVVDSLCAVQKLMYKYCINKMGLVKYKENIQNALESNYQSARKKQLGLMPLEKHENLLSIPAVLPPELWLKIFSDSERLRMLMKALDFDV